MVAGPSYVVKTRGHFLLNFECSSIPETPNPKPLDLKLNLNSSAQHPKPLNLECLHPKASALNLSPLRALNPFGCVGSCDQVWRSVIS